MKNYIGAAIITTLMACSSSPKEGDAVNDSAIATTDTSATSINVKIADPHIQKIYTGYISLKNSLVAANAKAARQTASDLSAALKGYAGCENTALIADKIGGTEDLKEQRKEFTALSSDVIALFKHVDLEKGSIYVQHCPMANNGDGGDWLSSEKTIRNPYYGDEMLECGAVVEVIKTKI